MSSASKKIYVEVERLATDMINASVQSQWRLYRQLLEELRGICEREADGRKDPLLWEVLGDFAASRRDGIRSYLRALRLAEAAGSPQSALLLEIGKSHGELRAHRKAVEFLERALELARVERNGEVAAAASKELTHIRRARRRTRGEVNS